MIPPEVIDAFWSQVDRSGDCWEWTGKRNQHGYGVFTKLRGYSLAHRAGRVIQGGELGRWVFCCHTCDNPPCVKGDHLYAGSSSSNAADARERNRFKRCCHPRQLTPEQLATIELWRSTRETLGITQMDLAAALEVHPVTIAKVEVGTQSPSKRLSERLLELTRLDRDELLAATERYVLPQYRLHGSSETYAPPRTALGGAR